MKNGIITIGKDAGPGIGYFLLGGEIHINGHAKGHIGTKMKDGKIYLQDETATVSMDQLRNSKGKIYCKGKRIK